VKKPGLDAADASSYRPIYNSVEAPLVLSFQLINVATLPCKMKRSPSRYTTTPTRSSAIAVIADRTACSILTLFVVSTTSRPLNKNPFAVSPQIQLTITADLRPQIRSPHTSLHVQSAQHRPRQSHRTAQCHC